MDICVHLYTCIAFCVMFVSVFSLVQMMNACSCRCTYMHIGNSLFYEDTNTKNENENIMIRNRAHASLMHLKHPLWRCSNDTPFERVGAHLGAKLKKKMDFTFAGASYSTRESAPFVLLLFRRKASLKIESLNRDGWMMCNDLYVLVASILWCTTKHSLQSCHARPFT